MFKGDRKRRMSYAWKRAVRAIAVTSSTTAAAFLANTLSPMMPIQSFGVYAAIIIPANYLLLVLFFPPAVIFYEDKLEKINCCPCLPCGKSKESKQEDPVPTTDRSGAATDRSEAQQEGTYEIKEESKIDKFYAGPWNTWVHKGRFVIIIVFIAWTIFAAIKAF